MIIVIEGFKFTLLFSKENIRKYHRHRRRHHHKRTYYCGTKSEGTAQWHKQDKTSCAARWPPQYAPARDLDF